MLMKAHLLIRVIENTQNELLKSYCEPSTYVYPESEADEALLIVRSNKTKYAALSFEIDKFDTLVEIVDNCAVYAETFTTLISFNSQFATYPTNGFVVHFLKVSIEIPGRGGFQNIC